MELSHEAVGKWQEQRRTSRGQEVFQHRAQSSAMLAREEPVPLPCGLSTGSIMFGLMALRDGRILSCLLS